MKIVYHEAIQKYDFPGTPIRGERFAQFLSKFAGKYSFTKCDKNVDVVKEIRRVHEAEYIEKIHRIAKKGGFCFPGTHINENVLEGATASIATLLYAAEIILDEGKMITAFTGNMHHAGKWYGEYYSIFNGIAVLVNWFKRHGYSKIFILDYDAHAGKGTMDIFYNDPTVFVFDIHQDPSTMYPGTGFYWEIGEGDGEGYKCNVPLPRGASDQSFQLVFEKLLRPIFQQYKPEVFITYGGADICQADPTAKLEVTSYGLYNIGRFINMLSNKPKFTINIISSGYNSYMFLDEWDVLLSGLLGINIPGKMAGDQVEKITQNIIEKTMVMLMHMWNFE
ncbi:MAG: hypothetical protein QXL15_03050 [Candidatus Korarchaeota archaeon]